MKRFSLSVVLCASAIVLALSAPVTADTIQLIDPVTGHNSGWQASFPPSANVSLVVDAVTPDAVFISKFTDFDQPLGPGGLIPGVTIDFVQTRPNAQTVPNVVIVEEGLTNLTGVAWTGFNFTVIDTGEAWIDVPRSANFSTAPFANRVFAGLVDGDPDRATMLRASDGTVPYLDTFFPGAGTGELWIDVDLNDQPITSFLLRQIPVPEPTTLVLLGALGAMTLRRRRGARRQAVGHSR